MSIGSSERSVSLPGAAQVLDGAKPSRPTGPPTDLLRDFLKLHTLPKQFFEVGNAFGRLR